MTTMTGHQAGIVRVSSDGGVECSDGGGGGSVVMTQMMWYQEALAPVLAPVQEGVWK